MYECTLAVKKQQAPCEQRLCTPWAEMLLACSRQAEEVAGLPGNQLSRLKCLCSKVDQEEEEDVFQNSRKTDTQNKKQTKKKYFLYLATLVRLKNN